MSAKRFWLCVLRLIRFCSLIEMSFDGIQWQNNWQSQNKSILFASRFSVDIKSILPCINAKRFVVVVDKRTWFTNILDIFDCDNKGIFLYLNLATFDMGSTWWNETLISHDHRRQIYVNASYIFEMWILRIIRIKWIGFRRQTPHLASKC